MSSIDDRTCLVLSRSRRVTDLSLIESKSTVIPNGVPSSSLRAYRLPILLEELSMLFEIPMLRNLRDSSLTIGMNVLLLDSGTIKTFVGAISGGSEST